MEQKDKNNPYLFGKRVNNKYHQQIPFAKTTHTSATYPIKTWL